MKQIKDMFSEYGDIVTVEEVINRRKTAKETTINALDSAINLNIA